MSRRQGHDGDTVEPGAAQLWRQPSSERTLDPTEVVVRLDEPLAAAKGQVERAMVP